ncbi:hypothetical protein B0H16DRAFT_1822663 [Mycena metata]|uniref:Novel STAND NTPase 1 domain-containing protein n=1 Tax=Mycena metata TaxID=1033252 RepID=A0AAD7JA85_9AGAR|nr:hypothetical protein B0H16DRAFT_1822663 [Mycena metata]
MNLGHKLVIRETIPRAKSGRGLKLQRKGWLVTSSEFSCLNSAEVGWPSGRTPFLEAIAATARSLLQGVEVGIFTIPGTIHKIHTFFESQQSSSRLRRFFRQAELSALLKDCKAGLQWAHDVFKIKVLNLGPDVEQMRKTEEMMHQEVLNMIENLSDGTASDAASTGSFPRIAVLGAGGMGKTSLARAVVHDPQIMSMFEPNRHFVLCESCTTEVELAALIGAHIGMKPGKDLTRQVLQYFSIAPPCLLVLDNLETVWEPLESRRGTEEFLSLLTEVARLAVMITMRGVERPGKLRWTHPFLHPLKPLEYTSARQAFIDIADDTHDPKELDKVLSLTDCMPLAINLLAHLVDSEGCFHVLTRWAKEKISIISSKDLLSLLSLLPNGLSDTELVQSGLPINKILACKTALLGTSLAYSDEYKKLKVLMPIREYMQRTRPPGDHLIKSLLFHFKAAEASALLNSRWRRAGELASAIEPYQQYRGGCIASTQVAGPACQPE